MRTAYLRSVDPEGPSKRHYSTCRSLSKDFILSLAYFISMKILLLTEVLIIFMVIIVT